MWWIKRILHSSFHVWRLQIVTLCCMLGNTHFAFKWPLDSSNSHLRSLGQNGEDLSELVLPLDFHLGSVCEMFERYEGEYREQKGSSCLFQTSVETWMVKWSQQMGRTFFLLSVSILLGVSGSVSVVQAFRQCGSKYKLEHVTNN